MGLPRSVAALATERGLGRPRIRGLSVLRVRDVLGLRVVTDHARVVAGIPGGNGAGGCAAVAAVAAGCCGRWRPGVHQARCGDANPEAHHDADKEAMSM